jgi:hypothetical protein
MAGTRLFDLNIEEVLEHWETHHAIREVIANALDEQRLSGTPEISIRKDTCGIWHIRDFGRGLKVEHLTQNENVEKLEASEGIIGKFGVGLKDALATFHRRGIGVEIHSSSGVFRVRQAAKHGFEGILTLHVEYENGPMLLRGTDVLLTGVHDEEMEKAKNLFLHFSEHAVLEQTPYGQILEPPTYGSPMVYINGVYANEEANFLFSYNVTSLTGTMKKQLNRERLSIGRTIYVDRVKAILKLSRSAEVRGRLADQVLDRAGGTQCDELQWIEIAQLALNLLHERRNVAYVTEREVQYHPEVLDSMRRDGHDVVFVSEQQKARLQDQISSGGQSVRILETFLQEYNQTFQYTFVPEPDLSPRERVVFGLVPALLGLVRNPGDRMPLIKISETIRISTDRTNGVWDSELGAIVVKRSQLQDPVAFAGTLLHEYAHASSGHSDVTREFERTLTDYLGRTSMSAVLPRR